MADACGKTQSEIKKEHFKDVTQHWVNARLLVYTGTLAMGVDFSLSHFDTAVHVYSGRASGANLFVQSTLRVRQLWDKEHFLYLCKNTELGVVKSPL